VELATGSAFRAGGCGHPPRDQLPHLSGLDLTTELLSEFVSPRFDHGIMGNPGDRTVGTIEGHRDLGRFYEQPVQFLLQHGRRPIHEPVPPGQIPLSKAPKPSHITKESGIPPLTISPLHRHAQKLTCTLPAQTLSICGSRKWHAGLGFARFTGQGGPGKDLPHMPGNEEPRGPAPDAGRNSDPGARPGLIRRDRGPDGELASRGGRAGAEVSWSGSPRLWRGLVTLFLVLMVVFSVIPLTIDLLGKPNKDYRVWYQVGVVIRQGMNIYPDPATGRLFPFMYPPSAAAVLGFLSILGKHATTLVLVLAHSAAWIGAIAPSLCIIALIHNTYLLGQPNLTLLTLLLAAFACLRLGREAPAGVLVATAAAIKAFPILALGYFVYRRMWRAALATVAALLVWLLVVPLPFRTPAQAMADLAVWSRGMVFTYNAHGIAQRP